MESEIVEGSLEVILPNGKNESIVVKAVIAADVPVLVRAVFGLDAPATEPVPQDAPPTLAGAWNAQTALGQQVAVRLWRDPTADE